MDIYSDIQRRTEYQNILARGGGYTDPNAPALDPYGVNADAARRDEATGQVPTSKATTTPISTDGSQQGGGTYYSTSGGGTATQQTGGIPTEQEKQRLLVKQRKPLPETLCLNKHSKCSSSGSRKKTPTIR
jgi:hypothetical protein